MLTIVYIENVYFMNERERIEYLIELYGLTPSQFADRAGIPRASVSHILGGRNKPSLEILQKVAAVFPNVDIAWLMLGVGETPTLNKENVAIPSAQTVQEGSLFSVVEEPVQVLQPVAVQKPRIEEPSRIQKNIVSKQSVERVQRKSQRVVEDVSVVKKIKEIRVFYSDGTFEILYPEK